MRGLVYSVPLWLFSLYAFSPWMEVSRPSLRWDEGGRTGMTRLIALMRPKDTTKA